LFKTDYEDGRLQPTPAGHPQLATPRASYFLLVLFYFSFGFFCQLRKIEIVKCTCGKMEQAHRDLIRDNWLILLGSLCLDDVLPVLYQNRFLSQDLIDQINCEKTPKDRTYAFLVLIQKRGPNAFPALLAALYQTDQLHLCDRLQPGFSATRLKSQRTSQGKLLTQPEHSETTSALEEDLRNRLMLRDQETPPSNVQTKSPNQDSNPPKPNCIQIESKPEPERRSSVDHSIRQFPTIFDIKVKPTRTLPLDFNLRLGNGEIYPNFSRPKGTVGRNVEKIGFHLNCVSGLRQDYSYCTCCGRPSPIRSVSRARDGYPQDKRN
jgi:hypothetical protein